MRPRPSTAWPPRPALVAASVLLLTVACGGDGLPLPEELRGTWTTDDPRYEGRALFLGSDSVRFYTGGGEYSGHPVQRLEIGSSPTGVAYELRYEAAGGDYLLTFELRTGGDLVLSHQPELRWSRASGRAP